MNKKLLTVSIIIGILVVGGYLVVAKGDYLTEKLLGGKSMSYEVIDSGQSCGITEKNNYVIRNRQEWSGLWNRVDSRSSVIPSLLEVDFDKYMVIGVFLGEKNTGGYAIEVEKIVEEGEKIIVHLKETTPGKDDMVIQVLTQPYQIIKIEKTTKEIMFKYD